MLPHTLISTVGTSLFGNLEAEKVKSGTSDVRVTEALKAFEAQNWSQLAIALRRLDPADRLCGAEINSISDLLVADKIRNPPFGLHFCLSATVDGRALGAVLRPYYEGQGFEVRLHEIESLQDDSPADFRTSGLRNLARCIGETVRHIGDSQFIAINATGGYKAQIAIAVLIGQALGISVFYKHEKFSEIISFPPMPLSFDYDLLGRESALLDHVERGELIEMEEHEVNRSLRVLLEETEGQGSGRLWALAPIGQIYLDGFRQRYPPAKTLPAAADHRSDPSFRDDHYPDGFKEFVRRVWRDHSYIKTCHSLPYDRQKAIRNREFHVRDDGTIVGDFRSDFGARFAIMTTATSAPQRAAVVVQLNEEYGGE